MLVLFIQIKIVSNDYVSSIEEQFSKKFDVKLSLSQSVCEYDGIKSRYW